MILFHAFYANDVLALIFKAIPVNKLILFCLEISYFVTETMIISDFKLLKKKAG